MINIKNAFEYECELHNFEHEQMDRWTNDESDNQTKNQ